MYELMKVELNENQEQVVSGRMLHEFLEVKTAYKDWFPRMCEYGFEEGKDFSSILSESTGGRPSIDHALKLDMAKEISMLQRTERGKQARQYFIEVEKRFKAAQLPAMTHLEMIAGIANASVEHERAIRDIASRQAQQDVQLQRIKDVVVIQPDQKRQWINNTIRKIVASMGGQQEQYRHLKTETYQLLNSRLGVNVYTRRANKRAKGYNMRTIDIIMDDKKLTEGYISILKEYAIKYGISD